MTKLRANPALKSALSEARGLTAVHDEGGSLLGYFVPPSSPEELRLFLRILAEYDPAETERRVREASGKGMTTQEVLAYLNSLDRPACATP